MLLSACSDVYNVLEEKNREKTEEVEGEKSKAEWVGECETEGDKKEEDTGAATTESVVTDTDVSNSQAEQSMLSSHEEIQGKKDKT